MSGTMIIGATLVHPDRLGRNEYLAIDGDRISDVGTYQRPLPGWTVIEAHDLYVLPGLVDIHAHGAHGHNFNEADSRSWRYAADAHQASGTTSVLATLASDAIPTLTAALTAGRDAEHPAVIGAHLEGPYLNPRERGAHPAAALRLPSDRSWRPLLDTAGFVRLMTLAPELPGARELITSLRQAGIVASAGHSTATAEHLGGITHIAHLWSGQSTLSRNASGRTPGLLETALASHHPISAELIADGHHLPAELVTIAYRCLGPDRLCLVSDSCAGTGLPEGTEFSMGACSGIVGNGVAISSDGHALCGSTSFLADTLRFAVHEAHLPLVDAVRMASTTPARTLGLGNEIGSLTPGTKADLLITGPHLEPRAVMTGGRWLSVEGIDGAA